ncbi:MAG: endonuclease/exonuclease/phosphatase family protein, partial [Treponema sp.]|nr:endonuclease/exonuclease/phosphatase family protein [Treponema sp.]
MLIFSWNVNGIRAVEKHGFEELVKAESADMVCIQETKARPDQLSEALTQMKDKKGKPYFAYWSSAKKPGYAGTAIYTKVEPLSVTTMGVPQFDDEGRVLQAEFKDFTLICAYFPNSQEEGRRLDYKLAFCAAMMKLCKKHV